MGIVHPVPPRVYRLSQTSRVRGWGYRTPSDEPEYPLFNDGTEFVPPKSVEIGEIGRLLLFGIFKAKNYLPCDPEIAFALLAAQQQEEIQRKFDQIRKSDPADKGYSALHVSYGILVDKQKELSQVLGLSAKDRRELGIELEPPKKIKKTTRKLDGIKPDDLKQEAAKYLEERGLA